MGVSPLVQISWTTPRRATGCILPAAHPKRRARSGKEQDDPQRQRRACHRSTSGIGLAIARALAAEGANVMLNASATQRRSSGCKAEIAAAGGAQVAYSGADLTRPSEIEGMMAQAAEQLGGRRIWSTMPAPSMSRRWTSSRPRSGTC
jgi:hypothetical protein